MIGLVRWLRSAKPVAHGVVVLLTVHALSVATAAAQSDEQRARAREAYTRGQTEFAAGHYAEALAAFQEAYENVPNPAVLLGIASAHEGAGDRPAAARALRRYLRARPDASDRATVEQRIATLDPEGATVLTTGVAVVTATPESATLTVDDDATVHQPPVELELEAGTHTLTFHAEGYEPLTREVEVARDARVEVGVALVSSEEAAAEPLTGEDDVFGEEAAPEDEGAEEEEAVEDTPTDAGQGGPSAAVWVTTAIAGVGLVTGTVFGFLALSAQSDFDARPNPGSANDGEAFALVADLAFGVAVIAGVTAIVLYATETPSGGDSARREDTQGPRVAFSPVVSPDMGGAVLRLEL